LTSAPKVDKRTAADVARQLQQMLKVYAPGWNEIDPDTGAPKGVSGALIGVAARFSEIIIQRLNQVPQKNFLAFLELLGAALLPPEPAEAPLTFSLAPGSVLDAVVPAGTQVAAPPAPGEKDPVIYETQSELVVAATQLVSAVVRDPEDDTYADYSDDLVAIGSDGIPIFHGSQAIDHILYLGQSQFFASTGIINLSLKLELQAPAGDALNLLWEIWDGVRWLSKTPASDETGNLQQSGTIQFGPIPSVPTTTVNSISNRWIRCRLLTPVTPSAAPRTGMVRTGQLPRIRSVGVRVHLHNEGLPVEAAFVNFFPVDLSKDFFPFGEKPHFNDTLWMALEEAFSNAAASVTLSIKLTNPNDPNASPLPAQASSDLILRWEVWNGAWIELGTSTPKGPVATTVNGNTFKDTTNAFTLEGDIVFTMPPQVASFNVNGKESFWIRVRIISGNYGLEGRFVAKAQVPAPPVSPFDFILPDFHSPSIRSIKVMYDLNKPDLKQDAAQAEAVLIYNDSKWADVTAVNNSQKQSFAPFTPSQDSRPTLYFGFVLPPGRTTFPNNTLTLFFSGADLRYGQKTIPLAPDLSRGAGDPNSAFTHKFLISNPGPNPANFTFSVLGTQWAPAPVASIISSGASSPASLPAKLSVPAGQSAEVDVQVTIPQGTPFGASDSGFFQLIADDQTIHTAEFVTYSHEEAPKDTQLRVAWEYWDGEKWATMVVRDETSNFTTAGVVEFLAPPDFAAHPEFGMLAWWLRVRWEEGDYDTDPRVNRVLLNTTMAAQTITIRNEVLGSSDGSQNQTFQTTRTPVLAGQSLQVRELEMPSGDERDAIIKDEGADAVSVVHDSAGNPSEIWVRWHEVPDFYAAGSRSRHYTLDHNTGEVRFGDGRNGFVPPVGSANLRLARYQAGGGIRGNRPARSIVQMKTTLPYIDKVVNYDAATGGANAESLDSLVARAPREIRHRRRAVTLEDYEDLAHLASPEVTRALCVPNRDLVADPTDRMPLTLGNVSLIIVPNTTDPRPQPSIELVQRVQRFISASCPVTATVLVIGPLYLRVSVQVEIGLASLEGSGAVAQKVQDALAAFLHPLTGGFDSQGWEFGREPHRSDLYTLIKQVRGVDHIRSLTVQDTEDFPGARETGRFLVYSGIHSIKLVFEPS